MDADGADKSVFSISPQNTVMVEGFTVQGANHTSGEGGGFFINGATVVISDTLVQDNTSGTWGGGVYVEEVHGAASVSLVHSKLLRNRAIEGGGLYGNGLVTLDHVTVSDNVAQKAGGGLMAYRATIANSRIVGNTAGGPGGGVHAGGGGDAATISLVHSELLHNKTGDNGGGLAGHGHFELDHVRIAGNTAQEGGSGLAATESQVTIAHSRITGNKNGNHTVALWSSTFTLTNVLIADNDGQGVVCDEHPLTGTMMNVTIASHKGLGLRMHGDIQVVNSILWDNGVGCGGKCTIAYSDVEGGWAGTGNLDADPQFVDAARGDYRLAVGSPCIDKGTPVGAPAADIEGSPRDAVPDMGVYEWTGFRIYLPLTLRD